jgi:hypothetical protein
VKEVLGETIEDLKRQLSQAKYVQYTHVGDMVCYRYNLSGVLQVCGEGVTSKCYRLSTNTSHAPGVDSAIAAVEVCTFLVYS